MWCTHSRIRNEHLKDDRIRRLVRQRQLHRARPAFTERDVMRGGRDEAVAPVFHVVRGRVASHLDDVGMYFAFEMGFVCPL